ncbi:MAG: hypothetical protein ACRC1O_17760, partial [Ralstonia mannitolilytica]
SIRCSTGEVESVGRAAEVMASTWIKRCGHYSAQPAARREHRHGQSGLPKRARRQGTRPDLAPQQ